jgi:hypothetical protein
VEKVPKVKSKLTIRKRFSVRKNEPGEDEEIDLPIPESGEEESSQS